MDQEQHQQGCSDPKHPWLTTPLYAFTLPAELLEVISVRSLTGKPSTSSEANVQESQNGIKGKGRAQEDDVLPQTALGCNLCGVKSFDSIIEQRAHFSSDWHRFNVKQKVDGKDAAGEHEWNNLLESLSQSLSGSASSSSSEGSSSDDEDGDSTISRVLAKQKLNGSVNGDAEEDEAEFTSPKSPLVWFETTAVLQDTQFGIYRTIFPSATKKSEGNDWLRELKSLQLVEDSTRLGKRYARSDLPPTDPSTRTWTLLAVGGGHFAGMVVSLVPRLHNKNGRIEREVVVLESKTFHRYTTRRKQGGAQSANDQSKGKAKSAGAQIRRYNEAMLTDEIRALLGSWREQIDASDLVFLRAGKTSHRIFYDYENPVLKRGDTKIRGFPFPTRRPTQAELIRCFTELTRLKISHLTAQQLAQIEEAYMAAMAPKKAPIKASKPETPKLPEVPKLSKEELLTRDRWERVVDMARKGRLDPLKTFIERQTAETSENQASGPLSWLGRLPDYLPESKASPTLLHVAASNDQPEVVRWLLLEQRADPTLASLEVEGAPGPIAARTAYECASSKAARDVFRRAYADHPDWYDWPNAAKVPSQLTEEMEANQNAKSTERSNKLKEKLRAKAAEREKEEKEEMERARLEQEAESKRREEARRSSASTVPRRLGGSAPRAVIEQTQLKGLSEEARMRIERERRAKAAEARLNRN